MYLIAPLWWLENFGKIAVNFQPHKDNRSLYREWTVCVFVDCFNSEELRSLLPTRVHDHLTLCQQQVFNHVLLLYAHLSRS